MNTTLPANKKKPIGTDIIYVDLDSLLDTRLGTLALLKNEYAVNALLNGYTTRDRDEFVDVPYEIFKSQYEKRNVDTLSLSTFTDVFVLLHACIKSTFEAAATNPNIKPLQVQVNVFPYDLNEDEMAEISVAVWSKLKEMADVDVVNVNDAFLTPEYCKDTYSMMIRYDYQSWLKTHHDSHAFEKTKMTNVTIIAPAIYQNRPSEQEMVEMKDQKLHPFTAAEFAMAPFFSLRLTDVGVFCISKELLSFDKTKTENNIDDGIKVEETNPPNSNASEKNQLPDDGFSLF